MTGRRLSSGSAIRDPRSQLALALVAGILGFLVVGQLNGPSGGSALQSKSAQDLTTLVANLNAQNDDLRAEISDLQKQRDELRADRAGGATSLDQIQTDLARIRAWSGLDPVAGKGVRITITGEVGAASIDDLLNELRNAGAEAIAVEDVRVVARTTVGGVPGSLDVDGLLLRDPFTIRAIGKPEVLVGSLTRVGGIIAQIGATNPSAIVDVKPTDKLMTLPASSRDLLPQHGRPVS